MQIKHSADLQADRSPGAGKLLRGNRDNLPRPFPRQRRATTCRENLLIDDPYFDIPTVCRHKLLDDDGLVGPACQGTQLLDAVCPVNKICAPAVAALDDEREG